ncbi:MAG: DUF4230 domain-containing protein [Candidatus Sulfotelmatobacter sp.]
MAHNPDAGPLIVRKPARSSAAVVVALILGLLLGVVCVGATGWAMLSRTSGRAVLSHMWSALTGRTLTIDVSQPTVVDRIQRLQRLETVVYTMDKIVTGERANPIFPDFLAGLHLPVSQVFSTRIDSARTRVYSRQTGLLVPSDPNLETQVRLEGEHQLQEAALADGILRTAQDNAASTVRSLLQGLGFEKIEFY